ncbi:hypothetical protein [Mameliella sp.]|uniref:hypothetical protein n=1 Tax=Mameliella sp. TaxID=1924940 RepID=UPI003B505946
MTNKTMLAAAIGFALISASVQADHANPWAGEDDTVLSRNHDANQARSIGTPGENEMRGVMNRRAHGKLADPRGFGGAAGGASAWAGGDNGGGIGKTRR